MRLDDLLQAADHYVAANTRREETLREPMGDAQDELAYQEAIAAEYDQGETYQDFMGLA